MKTIAICSLSGGQGKTTTTLLLGRALAAAGHTVCLIDADPQHSLTLFSGVKLERDEPSLLELFKGLSEPVDCVYPLEESEQLFIIPSDDSLDAAHEYLASTGMGAAVLKRRLESLRDHFTFCIIDCPPQRSQIVLSALGAADSLIVPSEATVKGFVSAARTLDLFNGQRDIGACDAQLVGLLPMRDRWIGRNQSKESQLSIQAMHDEVGEDLVLAAVPESEQYKRAMSQNYDLSNRHKAPFEAIAEQMGASI